VIKDRLNEENCLAITFEEDFELEVASVQEQILLRNEEVDIVFIIPDSEGSAAELALFARDPIIKTKLRVLVPHEFHPLYTEETSFLTSYYLELMSDLGHIYPYDPDDETHPSSQKIASKMMQSYRLRKLATSLGN